MIRFAGSSESAIWIKDETAQVTGAFKFRGVIAKLSTLPPTAPVVAASTGNHGLGVARASQILGMRAVVFVPRTTPEVKRRGIQDLGATLQLVDGDYDAAEHEARAAIALSPHTPVRRWLMAAHLAQALVEHLRIVVLAHRLTGGFEVSRCP